MIPDYQTLMLPLLRLADHGETSVSDAVEVLSDQFALTDDERKQMPPSGRTSLMRSRVHWAKTYLSQAGFITMTKRAHFQLSERGRAVLRSPPERLNNAFLTQFPEFREFQEKSRKGARHSADTVVQTVANEAATPEDTLNAAFEQITDAFIAELIDRLIGGTPAFFEKVIVELLLAMGYGGSATGSGRTLGKSGDNGVDGVIDQDPLGLDQLYIQAKLYQHDNPVGAGAIRDFYGALSLKRAKKGIFVTTSSFTRSALETAAQLDGRLVLIDGERLGQLMVCYNVGCRDKYALHIKDFDEDFFE